MKNDFTALENEKNAQRIYSKLKKKKSSRSDNIPQMITGRLILPFLRYVPDNMSIWTIRVWS